MKTFIFVILSLFVAECYAQNLQMNFGELIPTDRRAQMLDAGMLGNKLFIIEKVKKTISLKFYNPTTLKYLSSRIVQQENCKGIKDCINDDFGYEKTLFMKDKIIMFFSSYEKSSKQNILFAQIINDQGNFEGKLVIIDKIPSESRRNAGGFLTWQCKDSTKFLVIQNPPFEKYAGEKFVFKVYNTKLENSTNFSAALPYKDKDLSVSDYYLGNDGTIYMLANIMKEKKEKGEDRSFYSVFSFKGKEGTMAEFLVKLPEKNIETIALRLDENANRIICSGLYSDISKGYEGKKIDGLFYLRADVTNNVVEATGFKTIENSVLAEILDVKEEKIDKNAKKAAGSKNFEIMDLIPRKDGTTTLVTEYRTMRIVTTTSTVNGVTTTTTTYHYYRKNIFVINIAKDGSILSFTNIPKNQYTINDFGRFSSFLLFEKDERLFFIYNDAPENLFGTAKSLKEMKRMGNVAKATLVAVEMKKDGSVTKQKVYDVPQKKIVTMPESGIKVGDGQYIMPITMAPSAFSCNCFAIFTKMKYGISKIVL